MMKLNQVSVNVFFLYCNSLSVLQFIVPISLITTDCCVKAERIKEINNSDIRFGKCECLLPSAQTASAQRRFTMWRQLRATSTRCQCGVWLETRSHTCGHCALMSSPADLVAYSKKWRMKNSSQVLFLCSFATHFLEQMQRRCVNIKGGLFITLTAVVEV